MKKRSYYMLVSCVGISLGLNNQSLNVGATDVIEIVSAEAQQEVIVFKDAKLEAQLKQQLNLSENEVITKAHLEMLSELSFSGDIKSLDGLQYATNVKVIKIDNSEITDLSPLSQLGELTELVIDGSLVSDVTPISNLSQLKKLQISNSNISTIGSLDGLNLESLSLMHNKIKDVNLTKIPSYLNLDYNQISQVGQLGLSNEVVSIKNQEVKLQGQKLANQSFKLANPVKGFAQSDRLSLEVHQNGVFQSSDSLLVWNQLKEHHTVSFAFNDQFGSSEFSGRVVVELSEAVGWYAENGKWYYKNSDGQLHKGWLTDASQKYYLKSDGTMAIGWECVDGNWYYFASSGAMKTGWLQEGSKKYYLKSNGTMAIGWECVDGNWYYFASSGAMKTGWLQEGSKRYYLKSDGVMASGWLKDGGKWYYLWESGSMAKGWVNDGGTWYYLNTDGVMKTGWLKDGTKWYYLKSNGMMASGWLKDGGTWYYLWESGSMATGWVKEGSTWYYLRTNGAMVTGVEKINGEWYYFNASGKMERELGKNFNGALYNQAIASGKSTTYAFNYAMYSNVKTNFYKDIKTLATPSSITALVNKNYRLPSDYVPNDLVLLDVPLYSGGANNKANYLRAEAAGALKSLFTAAKSENGYRLVARSGYRSYATQQSLYSRYVSSNGQAWADVYSARAGHSEHQTGLAIDITSASVNNSLSDSFATTAEGKWVAKNAHRFGFILRYPKGRVSEVGYEYEPWHLRYVGVEMATEIYEQGLILEDYVLEYGLIPATK